MQADSRKIISENIVADRSKLKIICVFLHRIYFGRIPYERQYRGKKRKAMNITELQQSYASHPNVEGVCRLLKDNSVRHLYCGGLYASAASLFSSVLVQRATCPLVFILGDMEEAGYFYHDLTQILGTEQVLFFPSSFRRAIKYGQKDAANEILRTEVLSRLQKGEEGLCVVTYPDALAEKVVSRKELGENTLKLHAGERVDMNFVTDVLRSYGFEYVDYVYEPGQYAVRGSIIDVFSFSSEYPFRIDFFGDEVESVRTFEVETQLSKEKKESIVIVPDLSHSLEKKGSGGMVSFLDFLPSDSLLAMRDFLWLRERIQTVHDESLTPQAIAARESEENGAITLEGKLIDGGEFTLRALDFRRMEFGNKPTGTPDATVSFHTTVQPIFHKNFDMVAESFREYLSRHYTIYICSDSLKQTDRIRAIFEDRGDNISFTAVERTLHEGFADDTLRICIFTDHQLFDRFHKYNLKSDKARSGKVALSLKELNQFTPGDYVVHTDHGVGRFAGLVRIPNGDTTQEVMKIVYQNEDVVFVSIHSLHKVSKYKGKEGEAPRLNKLGTGAWEKLKDRTKTKIKDIARDLIKLYSQRREEKGFQYSPDSFLQRELEASFIYEDTPDQSKATSDVKADMESARPMDRLVCGDVGFGKTEVAVRAAFKAVADNKQVAVLVPTTVLAYQHFQTFKERLKGLPCRVEYLSRARTAAQAKAVVKGLAEGEVNILIGTHRILGKDVKFKDLGLLIIDEEQHFGVAHKEKLKQLKSDVHVLTLTATPIPRTLQLSLTGVKQLSIIATPPVDRLAARTFVMPFDKVMIKEAVYREKFRGGQIFFVCPRVSDIFEVEKGLRALVPDVKILVAHGQMPVKQLEEVMNDFADGKADMLLSTTIIESGIDMPSVNTMIVYRSDMFGLAQLYQLKGRVGRGKVRGYAYFTVPPKKQLKPIAERRLSILQALDTLGAGFSLASHDMDIRGSGNILGEEQSGHIKEVGIALYQHMLEEEIMRLKSGSQDELRSKEIQDWAPQITTGIPIMIPESYVRDLGVRLGLYKRIGEITDNEGIADMREELTDRFGKLPEEVDNLLKTVEIKLLCREVNIEKVDAGAKGILIAFRNNTFAKPEKLLALIQMSFGAIKVRPDQKLFIEKNLESYATRVETIKNIITRLRNLLTEK